MNLGGRPVAKNADAFNAILKWEPTRREFLIGGLAHTLSAFSKKTKINRGTVSAIAAGRRSNLGYDDRLKVIQAFHSTFDRDQEEGFLDDEHLRQLRGSSVVLLDPPASPHPPLEPGQRLLVCASYPEALRELHTVFDLAASQLDYALQADAAARIAWAWFEQGEYQTSREWVRTGVHLIEKRVGASFDQIVDSIRPGSQSSLCPLNEEASHVLSRLLQVNYKIFIEQVVYYGREDLRPQALKTVGLSIMLDRHLQLPAAIGHDLRWRAVLINSEADPQTVQAQRLLAESRELFGNDSLGAAYLARDRGIFNWQMDRYVSANASLHEATDRLASFADSRALGPTFYVLSKVAWESRVNPSAALRFALAGAALHPYGFILKNARNYLKEATPTDQRRYFDEARSGAGPSEILAPVLSQLTDGSSSATSARLDENLSRILRQDVHSWLRHPTA